MTSNTLEKWQNQYRIEVNRYERRILEENRRAFTEAQNCIFHERCSEYQKVALEIGSGSGMHLLDFAEANPNTLCIGVELRYKRTVRTIEKGARRNIHNILMIRGDVKNALSFIEERQLSHLFIHFPDPWEKTRWRKHRLIQEPFLTDIIKKLEGDGTISFRTDHQEYFHEAEELLTNHSLLTTDWKTTDLFHSSHAPSKPSSEFESLFFSKQKPVAACLMRRISS